MQARATAGEVRRIVLCTGKVHVDLVDSEWRKQNRAVAVVRVEQLYPFPADECRGVLDAYPQSAEVVWLQEEPENMGAWTFVRTQLDELLVGRGAGCAPLRYMGRPASSSPAEGSTTRYALAQKRLVERAFDLAPIEGGRWTMGGQAAG